LTTEQGSGTFVAPQPAVTLSPRERQDKLAALCNEFLAQVAQYGFGPADVLQAVRTLTTEVHTRESIGRTRTGDRGRQAH
jgi:hypothetical protein